MKVLGFGTVFSALLLSLMSHFAAAQSDVITTVAGGGPNNLPATSANLLFPQGISVDGSGNLFITVLSRVFKVDTLRKLRVVAGIGQTGGCPFSDGPATMEELCNPHGVAVDGSGNIFFTDQLTNRIRKVDTSGAMSTIAGTGICTFDGDGLATTHSLCMPAGVAVDASGNVFVADQNNQRIRKVDTSGAMSTVAGTGICTFDGDGVATSHSMCNPNGLALDTSGDIFIADQGNQRVRKVDSSNNLTTVAGTGNCVFDGDGAATTHSLCIPSAVAVNASGNLFVADTNNYRIREVTNGFMTTVAGTGICTFDGDGPATSHGLCVPSGVAVDAVGNFFIVDNSYNQRIREVDSTGNMITVAGNGTDGFSGDGFSATSASLNEPFGKVAVDAAGNLFIADTVNERVRKVGMNGMITTVAGNGNVSFDGDGIATSHSLFSPVGVALDISGNLFVADRGHQRIRRVEASGNMSTIAGTGTCIFDGDGSATTHSLCDPSSQPITPIGQATA